jgi:hypothetical protein
MKGNPKDPRSTMRRRGRNVLFRLKVPYICNDCGRSPKILPADAPKDLELAAPYLRTVNQLQVNHINKDIWDNDPYNLEWLCPSCHKIKDKQTAKGVSIRDDDFGYDLDNL